MDIKYTYNSDVMSVISGSEARTLPVFEPDFKIKLSVYSNGIYRDSFVLEEDKDYYIKRGGEDVIILKPNDKLDEGGFFQGDYELQYDFIQRIEVATYIDEVSSTRKEIRVRSKDEGVVSNESFISTTYAVLHDNDGQYRFDGFIELPDNEYIPINSFAEDRFTHIFPEDYETENLQGQPNPTLIFKLNNPLSNQIGRLYQDFKIVRKFLPTQTQEIFLADVESLAIRAKALEVDVSGDPEETLNDVGYESYGTITGSFGGGIIDDFKRDKKDLNLNIDYSEFKNHIYFGSAVSKIENFKDKAVELEGLYRSLTFTLHLSSSVDIKNKRKKLFKDIKEIESNFTSYERFLYTDGQNYSTASAPGLGVNLAGSNFDNKFGFVTSSVDFDGFDKIHHFTSSNAPLHMFTNIYDVAEPPFYNTNNWVYLSFILSGDRASDATYDLITENSSSNVIYGNGSLSEFTYNKNVTLPEEAASGSTLLNPTATGSEYKRYIIKAQQNYWRPVENKNIINISWPVAELNEDYEILSGSNVISASISGSVGDGFAYGILDTSGQHTPYFFPNRVDEKGLMNPFTKVTGSVLPQGDLFPIRIKENGNYETYVSDVRVTYKDPTNTHPFSPIYRPPSGSYAGSTEWNSWYTGTLSSASLYDNDNIHSLVNNLPSFLREDNQHKTLRDFVNMLGEEFDLLRNYIDNYLNFYKLGYKNPNTVPNNLLPVIADSSGWKLISSMSSSLSDYIETNKTEEIGSKNAIDATWKKILNNLIYIYKTKGSIESIKSLLNIYGFNADSFGLREYGGSVQEHNPTVITNDAQDLLDGLGGTTGSITFVESIKPFSMLNVSSGSANFGNNRFGVDWFCSGSEPNGLELVFNAEEPTSNVTQSLMRLSGSNNDLWNINLIPEHNTSTTKGKIQFRLNRTANGSGTTHFSMETPLIDNLFGDNIYNLILQRNSGSDFEDGFPLSQSYQMFVGRKDDDAITNYHIVSMSVSSSIGNGISKVMAKRANRNFRNSGSIAADGTRSQNLLIGETLTGSIAEVRGWSGYLSSSKFKQHILNYESTVSSHITASFSDIIYRYKLNEGYINSDTNSDLASLTINDANPLNVQDYTHLLTTQDNLNFRTVTTEQTFYVFVVRGVGDVLNNNMMNLYPELYSQGSLNPFFDSLTQPYDGTPGRIFSNNFGTNLSYVNAIDSLIFNMIPDFSLENHIGDYDTTLSDIYRDLLLLRKSLIGNSQITVDVQSNLSSVENFVSLIDVDVLEELMPANTQLNFSYDIMNDVLYRNKFKNPKLQTELNPNQVVGSASFAKLNIETFLNNNVKNAIVDVTDEELTLSSTLNNNYKEGTVLAGTEELTISSTLNDKIKSAEIKSNTIYSLSSETVSIKSNAVSLNTVDLTNSYRENVYDLIPSNFTNLLLGSKNEFYKNHGKGPNQTWFKSANPGTGSTYNTYRYEDRFTFPTIGDTELYIPITASRTTGVRQKNNKHDEFKDFYNRNFIDSGQGYSYLTLYQENSSIDGRMVGRTSYFSSSEGNIYYPSNHFMNARTNKDVLVNLIYKGTQHNGTNPTKDPMGLDTQFTSSAYTTTVSGEGRALKIT